jgi:hypothetical protein
MTWQGTTAATGGRDESPRMREAPAIGSAED